MKDLNDTHLNTQNVSHDHLRKPQSVSIAGYNGERIRRTNTRRLSLCSKCDCMTYTVMDDDGNRYCGKCKEEKDEK